MAASLTRGFQLLSEGRFSEARTELERAQTLKGGPCGECLLGLSHVYAADKDWQRAEEAARQATALLKTPQALARAYNQLGMTLVQLSMSALAQNEFAPAKTKRPQRKYAAAANSTASRLIRRCPG